MGVKQRKLIFLLPVAVFMMGAAIFFGGAPTAYADYTAPTGGSCEDGSAPAPITRACADSTRKAGGSTTTPQNSGTTGDQLATEDDKDDVTCAVEKVGWIICPILESMAKISDYMFDVLANNFLRTDTSLFRDDSGTKVAWEIARNLANVMFIIAFLVIIVSQVTSMGISNYGIKKMLPRLVIAAIAVNVSYYICQLVVDMTNIFGYEIQNALAEVANSIGPSVFGNASPFGTADIGSDTTDRLMTVIAVAALASTAIWLILGPGLAVITMVIITVLAILIILLLRKALIVLLIVVSPIAFVLYLLPNTEKFFSKWMKMFGQLLMVFPVVGLLFGAGQLASTIILVSGATIPPTTSETCDPDAPATDSNSSLGGIGNSTNNSNSTSYAGKCDGYVNISGTRANPDDAAKSLGAGKGASWTLGLVAVGVAVAPLMAVYAVLKGALSAAGAIGGTVNSLAKRSSGTGGRLAGKLDKRNSEAMQAAWQRRQARGLESNSRGIAAGLARRRFRRDKRLELSKGDLDRQGQEYLVGQIGGTEGKNAQDALVGGLSTAGQQRAVATAEFTIEKLRVDEIDAEAATLKYKDRDSLRSMAYGDGAKNETQRLAAQKLVVEQADYEGMNQTIDYVTQKGSREMRAALADALAKSNARPAYVSQGVMSRIRTTNDAINHSELIRSAIGNNTYAAETMARTSKDELSLVGDFAINDSGVSQGARDAFVANANQALSDPQIARTLQKQKAVIEAIGARQGGAVQNIRRNS